FFKKDKKVKESFNSLSLSKQREYAEYISEAKRDETKQKRLLKIVPIILKGKGLNDKYR
ncbi:MAG: YdeI/OmpD-associated family protein, partial [Bacteroidetes bacterium]|nr:YdeI/OmpD-associated family protein [Bacteroidota bacterium]